MDTVWAAGDLRGLRGLTSEGGTMSEKSARPRFTWILNLKKLTRIIKTVTTAITGCGTVLHWPND